VPGVNDVRPPDGSNPKNAQAQADDGLSQTTEEERAGKSSTGAPSQVAFNTSPPKSPENISPEAKTRPKSKLRPLRNAITLTPTAITHIQGLLDQPEPKLLRIGTRSRGCSGLAYHLEYVDKPDKFDEVVRQDGVEVLVEGRALLTVLGSTMDWVDEKLGSRFVFTNPNISEYIFCFIPFEC
jgi:iron-sulfur cluster assembly 1